VERRTHEELVAVSAWWTPNHLDVTHVPMTYAKPKASWIDGYSTLRRSLTSDVRDRMIRRRAHDRSVVDPNEITVLPPLREVQRPAVDEPEAAPERRHLGLWFRPAH